MQSSFETANALDDDDPADTAAEGRKKTDAHASDGLAQTLL